MLNHFPFKWGISDMINPTKIMTGESLQYKKQLGLQIGQYCKFHEEDTPCNRNNPHNIGAICMGPSRNMKGGFGSLSYSQKPVC